MAYNRIIPAAFLIAAVQLPAQTIFNPAPSRIVGQAVLQQQGVLTAIAPNLVEGREFNNPQAVALDTSVTPPILYVADFGSNRVLAWKNASAFTKGDYADLVIGQRDLLSTAPQGPGAGLSTGLSSPVGLTVDARGNLYVVDAGNNRVLRYPAPFAQSSDLLAVDLIIGQPDLNSRSANGGQTGPTANTLALSNGSGVFGAGLALDAQANLWVSDAGNNRVLRYPASALASGAPNQPAADLVLGQNDFSSTSLPPNSTRGGKNYLSQPAGLAFDAAGRLFVADNASRVVVYAPPFAIGQSSVRVMGVVATPNAPLVSASTLNAPQAVFFVGSNPYVADTGNARILGYAPFVQWPAESVAFSPPAQSVLGQINFASAQSNQGLAQPTAATLAGPQPNPFVGGPVSAVFDNGGVDGAGTLYVVDSGNNRVLAFSEQQTGAFTAATRLLGQSDFPYNSLNRIDGRELGFSGNTGSCSVHGALPFLLGGSAAIDASSTPPHLYIADPLNNRVLGYRDYRRVNADVTADLVIGQPDLETALVNYPSNSPTQVNAQGLWSPEGLAVDAKGNLYVADTCNARVVRFPAPFAQTKTTALPQANLVLGQTSLVGQPIKDVSAQTMSSAYGLAFTASGDLVVSDPLANRVLYFTKTGGDFESGESVSNVFGQPDFNSSLAGVLAGPHLISLDSADQLYVADTGNNRIAVLPSVPTAGNNPPVLFSIAGLSNPYGVFVDPASGVIWISNTNANQVLQYASGVAVIENAKPSATLNVSGPVSVSTDPFGNPLIAEGGANRVGFYYPAIDYTTSAGSVPGQLSGNAANFFGRFAPGMLATIFAFPSAPFGDQSTTGDVQVSVGGTSAPLYYVSPSQINFQVPGAIPVGPLAEFQVERISTGQVLASWLFQIDAESPGLFTVDGSGSGQVVAVNQDGSMNNGANPAKAGSIVTLYATGQGAIGGMPLDGQLAQGILATPQTPQVFINSGFVPPGDVQFSGLAPGFAGLWQINVRVPSDAPPADVIVFLIYGGVNSILDLNGIRRLTTIRTTP